MGRPLKQYVDYFLHDSDASDRQTIFILEANFGNDGYAFWFKLLEILARKKGHFLDLRNGNELLFFSAKTHVSVEKTKLILDLLSQLGAIDAELWAEKIVWSQNFVNRLQSLYDKRKEILPLRPQINNISVAETIVSDTETHVSVAESATIVLKSIKDKSIKEKKTLVEFPPGFEEFWSKYPNKKCGKQNTLKSWNKINPDGELVIKILDGVERGLRSHDWFKEQGRFIPLATTWLNQTRWDAEYPEYDTRYTEQTRENLLAGENWLARMHRQEEEKKNGIK